MEPEYIAVTVCVSLLGGFLLILLLAMIIVKLVYDKKIKIAEATDELQANMMALQEVHEHPSYVHYPEPEPYTPTSPPETDPWRLSHGESSAHAQGPKHDTTDHAMPSYAPPRRPSMHHPYTRSFDGPVKRAASDVQYRSKLNVQGLARRMSYEERMPRRGSRTGNMEIRNGRRRSLAQKPPPADVHSSRKLPTRKGSLQPIPEPPNSEKSRLWYFYLNEEPDYFSPEAQERNKRRSKVWSSEKWEKSRSSTSAHKPARWDSFSRPQPHRQLHPRPQSFSQPQTYLYPPPPPSYTPDIRSQWM